MVESLNASIQIDLNEFKLHLRLRGGTQLTLHFNSSSRKFYLCLIALIIKESKKLGKFKLIPLQEYLDLLVLLNESVGNSIGSSEKEDLLHRIYRKWQDALPNLEEAPLFKVLGKKKVQGEGAIGKIYPFSDEVKDEWANLFEYMGSEENVRLKFAVDKIGIGLDDAVIIYDGSINGDAWDRFLADLKGNYEGLPEVGTVQLSQKITESTESLPKERKNVLQFRNRRVAVVTIVLLIAAIAALGIRELYRRPSSFKIASVKRMAFPLPDKPSIAVLPFVNMSRESEQEFFCDGLTDEIITVLSKSPYLFVIARTSTFKYKNKNVNIRQVSEELGVQYVLEGSVRRSGEKVRITAQFIDAVAGHHLWVERFDKEIKEIFTLQEEIAVKIMKSLHLKLRVGQLGSETGRGTGNLEIFLKSMEAREQALLYTKEGNARARKLFEEVVALDPKYARGYSGLAIGYAADVWLGTSRFPKESLAKAIELGQKGVSLDESDATSQATLAYLFSMTRQYEKAVSQAERALALDPNSYSVINNCGLALAYSGKYEEALPLLQRAARLNPSVAQSFVMSSMAYRIVGRYDEAYEEAKRAVERNPTSQLAQIALVTTCVLTGRGEDARSAAAEVLKINSTFSVERYGKALPFKDSHQITLVTNALQEAGLK